MGPYGPYQLPQAIEKPRSQTQQVSASPGTTGHATALQICNSNTKYHYPWCSRHLRPIPRTKKAPTRTLTPCAPRCERHVKLNAEKPSVRVVAPLGPRATGAHRLTGAHHLAGARQRRTDPGRSATSRPSINLSSIALPHPQPPRLPPPSIAAIFITPTFRVGHHRPCSSGVGCIHLHPSAGRLDPYRNPHAAVPCPDRCTADAWGLVPVSAGPGSRSPPQRRAHHRH